MAENTKIGWTTHTFNPWIGCSKVSAGCLNCYAEADQDTRRGRVKWGPHGTRSMTSPTYWKQPAKWNRWAADDEAVFNLVREHETPAGISYLCKASGFGWRREGRRTRESLHRLIKRGLIARDRCRISCYVPAADKYRRPRVFCASLADVFEDWSGPIIDHKGEELWKVTMDDIRDSLGGAVRQCLNLDFLFLTKRMENAAGMLKSMDLVGAPNVWVGASVESSAHRLRIDQLRDVPAAVRFLSIEPLLADLGTLDLTGIDWVIIGCESGPGRRPMERAWATSIVEQCAAAGVACFVKQIEVDGRVTTDLDFFPPILERRQFPERGILFVCELTYNRSRGLADGSTTDLP